MNADAGSGAMEAGEMVGCDVPHNARSEDSCS
jgi:hypothetical protein